MCLWIDVVICFGLKFIVVMLNVFLCISLFGLVFINEMIVCKVLGIYIMFIYVFLVMYEVYVFFLIVL